MTTGLQDRFIPDVEAGRKRHTIREGKRWRVGLRIDLFKDSRRSTMKLIFRAPVTKVEDIEIHLSDNEALEAEHKALVIVVDGQELSGDECQRLAQADGFKTMDQMYRFWMLHHYPRRKVRGWWKFEGQIIHWDYDKRSYEPVKRRRTEAVTGLEKRRSLAARVRKRRPR